MANGYTERFNDFVGLMRRHEATKDKIIIAGNVCTPEATEQIIPTDIVKIERSSWFSMYYSEIDGGWVSPVEWTMECSGLTRSGGHIITDLAHSGGGKGHFGLCHDFGNVRS